MTSELRRQTFIARRRRRRQRAGRAGPRAPYPTPPRLPRPGEGRCGAAHAQLMATAPSSPREGGACAVAPRPAAGKMAPAPHPPRRLRGEAKYQAVWGPVGAAGETHTPPHKAGPAARPGPSSCSSTLVERGLVVVWQVRRPQGHTGTPQGEHPSGIPRSSAHCSQHSWLQ